MMKLAIGNDHAGVELKKEIMKHLQARGVEVQDFGCQETTSVDYPVYGEKVGRAVAQGGFEGGILICGTGVGISLAANQVKGIRAVVCSEPYTAKMSKLHNNTNVLCFGARVIGVDMAKMITDTWLDTQYEGGRHQKRLDMLEQIEERR
ncbi:ribose 5-phosphate isomerase B [Clostridia bacterium]|nr:ribose 5-phosphate isomerase B [Clostridia bacterium]